MPWPGGEPQPGGGLPSCLKGSWPLLGMLPLLGAGGPGGPLEPCLPVEEWCLELCASASFSCDLSSMTCMGSASAAASARLASSGAQRPGASGGCIAAAHKSRRPAACLATEVLSLAVEAVRVVLQLSIARAHVVHKALRQGHLHV